MNGTERLDRIERILEEVAEGQRQLHESQQRTNETVNSLTASQRETAARQQNHDEAFDRHDAKMNTILDAVAADAENIRALARVAELHHRRLSNLEGGELA